LASLMPDLQFSLGSDPFFGPRQVQDVEVLPGNAQAVAISRRRPGVSPTHGGVAIFDNGAQRPNVTPDHTGSNVIEFSASSATLYGYNNETTEFGFRRMAVDSNGVTVSDITGNLITGFGVDIEFDAGRIYSTTGRVVDPAGPSLLGTFSGISFGALVEPDSTLGLVFFLTDESGTRRIRTYDPNTFLEAAAPLIVTGVSGSPSSLIRWGASGLAFRTSAGQIFLSQAPSPMSTIQTQAATAAAPPVRAAAPAIHALQPSFVVAGSEALKLGVRGKSFTEESVVRLRGKDLPTKFLSSTELEVELPAEALAQPGELKLTVFTPGARGGSSKPATLHVTSP